jgi:hypothetical protein
MYYERMQCTNNERRCNVVMEWITKEKKKDMAVQKQLTGRDKKCV